MKRIEHRFINGVELKWCSACALLALYYDGGGSSYINGAICD